MGGVGSKRLMVIQTHCLNRQVMDPDGEHTDALCDVLKKEFPQKEI